MYAPPIQAFCYVLRFSVTFIRVKWTPVDKLTQNLGFSIPFTSTFMIMNEVSKVYTYLRVGHVRTPNRGILLHITVFGYLFWGQMDTS